MKSILSLLLTVLCNSFCFSQAIGLANAKQQHIGPKGEGVIKVARTYTNSVIFRKKHPYRLIQEYYFNITGQVEKEVAYTYTESVFGIDTTIVEQAYRYNEAGKVQYMHKTFLSIVGEERSKKEFGYLYDQHGQVSKMLMVQPDGTLTEVQHKELTQLVRVEQKMVTIPDNPMSEGVTNTGGYGTWGARPHGVRKKSFGGAKHIEDQMETAVNYEPIQDGYIVREVTQGGKVVFEQRVLLNKQKQPLNVVASTLSSGKKAVISVANFLYDAAGNKVEQNILNKSGKLVQNNTYSYNERGYLASDVLMEKGKVKKFLKYEYEYF